MGAHLPGRDQEAPGLTMRSNCLVWAVAMWWRRRPRRRRYLTWRWSDWGWFPHVLYAELRHGRTRLVSYKPRDPRRRWIPPLLFDGVVRWGDPAPDG